MVMGQDRFGVVLSLAGEGVWSEARVPSGAAAGLWFWGVGHRGPAQRCSVLTVGPPQGRGGQLCGGRLEHQSSECGTGQGLPVCELTPGTWPWTRCTGSPQCQLSGCVAGQLKGHQALRCPGHPSWPAGLGLGRPRG